MISMGEDHTMCMYFKQHHLIIKKYALCNLFCFLSLLKNTHSYPSRSVVKNLPAIQETQEMQVQSLGWEDHLKETATCSSILAGESPWIEEPGGLQSIGLQRVGHD